MFLEAMEQNLAEELSPKVKSVYKNIDKCKNWIAKLNNKEILTVEELE